MYIGGMHRTQIYLDDEEARLLALAVERTGASRSELIRRAVRNQYGLRTTESRLAALQASAGSWSDRTQNGQQYVEGIRADLNDRLGELGLE
jgi:metal-responsive CopG/Arc/MetJ family transcriptional regulator